MANPRKFSEKIALQKQKQAEGTAEFERIMKEVYATKMEDTQTNQKNFDCCLGVVTAAGGSPDESLVGGAGGNNSPASYRESRVRSPGVGPMRRPSERKQDRSPYGSNLTNAGAIALSNSGQNTAYLSPPMDISWRRSNSDSALHQSLTNAVAADGNFAGANLTDSPENLGTMHTNYQLHDQRSLSPQICKSFSPQAQRRKGSMMPEPNLSQQQLQVHHHHQQQLQHHQLQQQQTHSLQLSLHQQHFNAKFFNCNMPVNNIFKTLQEQTMAIGNTGSLPDLTSKRFIAPTQQLIQQQEQQLTASPALSPHSNHNSCSDRDQSPSPFSPGNGGLPSSPYNQQQHSPTPATTPAAQTSPHLSFTNLTVQSPRSPQQSPRSSAAPYVHIHNMGAANSTGNLTDYRQPQNPPSPGSSPGLLTSVAGNDLHASEPSSPIRHQQKQTMMQQQQGYNTKAIQRACERYSDSSYNALNHSFHNHFEHFSLGDNTSLPDQQQQQHFQQQSNLYTSLEFDSFGATSDGNCIGVLNGQQQAYSPSLEANKLLDFNSLNVLPGRRTSPTLNINNEIRINTTAPTNRACRSNNNQQHQQLIGRTHATSPHQHQPLLNNNSTSINNPSTTNCPTNNNTSNFDTQHSNASAVVAPLSLSPLPSISTSLPIPISTQHQQPQQQTVSTPHHASPASVASPVLSSLGCAISPRPELSANTTLASVSHHPQNPSNKTQTSANIPSIIFSDYSSHSDFSREIFDTLDLDLGQMDVTGLQILSDPSTIMITDPTIEDSFRRDLN